MNIEQQRATKMYRETAIKTADGGQLIVVLYEEIDKHLTEAILLLKTTNHRSYDKVNFHITKAQEIIMELASALDVTKSKEIYDNLFNLYMFFNRELGDANSKKDYKKIIPIQEIINDLSETWKEAVAKSSHEPQPPRARGINLSG